VSSAKKIAGVRLRASVRNREARAVRDGGRDGGASGGGGAAGGGNLRPPPPASPEKGNVKRSKSNSSFTAYREWFLHAVLHNSTLNFTHPYSRVHIHTRSDLHDPPLRYPPLLPQKAGRPKLHRRHKSGLRLVNAKKRCHAPPSCTLCGMTGHKSNNTSWHPKT